MNPKINKRSIPKSQETLFHLFRNNLMMSVKDTTLITLLSSKINVRCARLSTEHFITYFKESSNFAVVGFIFLISRKYSKIFNSNSVILFCESPRVSELLKTCTNSLF
eukprot:NODE_679_length_4801_cov_0.851978.p7 type:complete len:108 gc:universal NODE_679_length_4801_cov_0.851978:3786-3463(-)